MPITFDSISVAFDSNLPAFDSARAAQGATGTTPSSAGIVPLLPMLLLHQDLKSEKKVHPTNA